MVDLKGLKSLRQGGRLSTDDFMLYVKDPKNLHFENLTKDFDPANIPNILNFL
jgi:hypothetical protein